MKKLLIISCGCSVGEDPENPGLTGRYEAILRDYCGSRLEIAVAYTDKQKAGSTFSENGITYYSLLANMETDSTDSDWVAARRGLLRVIEDFSPDVIHCFGAEWPYGRIAADTSVPVVIHMMGFLNVYIPAIKSVIWYDEPAENAADGCAGDTHAGDTHAGDTHAGDTHAGDTHAGDSRARSLCRVTAPLKRGCFLVGKGLQSLAESGVRKTAKKIVERGTVPCSTPCSTTGGYAEAVEREVMRVNRYFMGRTEWDRNIVKYYSPGSHYYHVNEVIKPKIYNAAGRWRYHYSGKIRLLTISSADDRKGNEIILRTARLLKELLGLDFTWKVAGSTEFFERYEKRLGFRHEDVNVEVTGRIGIDQIIRELTDADFFIHPSIVDNSPHSVCEAQLIGCPVISSNVGGLPQLITDGETGFLFPYNEPHTLAFLIGNLYRDEAYLTRVSNQAQQEALARHEPSQIAEELCRVYEEIIAGHKAGPKAANHEKNAAAHKAGPTAANHEKNAAAHKAGPTAANHEENAAAHKAGPAAADHEKNAAAHKAGPTAANHEENAAAHKTGPAAADHEEESEE